MHPSVAHHFVTLEGAGRVHYVAAGQGPPLVLLHGLEASIVTWRYNIGPLSEHYAVYAPDLPGHGDSAKPDVTYNLEFGLRFVLEFLDALSFQGAVLIGNSMGVLLALGTALRQPDRVQSLVLVDTVGLGRELAWPLRLASLPGIGRVLDALDVRSPRRFMRSVFYRPERVEPAIYDELLRLRKLPGVRRAVLSALRSGVNVLGLRPSHILLSNSIRLSVPTLVVWGHEDRIIPVEHSRQFVRTVPDARVCILPDSGHWPQMEQAQAFNNAVLAFLEHTRATDEEPEGP